MRLLSVIIFLLATIGSSGQIFVSDSIVSLFAGRVTDPVEGVWKWPDDGATMLICRRTPTSFTITILDSPRPGVRPGTKIGQLISAPQRGEYDCHIDPSALGTGKARGKDCRVTLVEGDRLMFSPYRRNDSFSLRRLVPYLLRVGFSSSNRPTTLDGARRIYPPPVIPDNLAL